ncbi:transposase [Dactylosporangium sp. NPDC000244]|uniref:transposase n=1 Tax=Dactylosporangium sp. NPDC000244 TaxID=3154365 RepID=UPI00331B80E8
MGDRGAVDPAGAGPATGWWSAAGGRRAVLAAVCYLTQAGCSWWKLPEAMFGVTRATAHRRFVEWTRAGLWPALHLAVLQRLQAMQVLDWSRAVIDSIQVRAEKGAI